VTLGVPRGDAKALTKQAASTMISQKIAEREAQPATGPQLRLLEVRARSNVSAYLLLCAIRRCVAMRSCR
jgi:hypothetical protein